MCIDCNDSLQINLPPAPSGINGQDGESAYVYIASADDASGTNFTYPQDPNQEYAAFLSTNTQLNPPIAANFTGLWVRVTGINGTNGTNGTNGIDGVNAGLRYTFAGYSLTGNPGTSKISFNAATATGSTTFYINYTDFYGTTVNTAISQSLSSSSVHKAILKVVKVGDESTYAFFSVTASLFIPPFVALTITSLGASSTNPFAVNDEVQVILIRTGEPGPTGPTGPAGVATSSGLTVNSTGLIIPGCLTGSVSSGTDMNTFLTGLMSYICSNVTTENYLFRGSVDDTVTVRSSLFNAGLPNYNAGSYKYYGYIDFGVITPPSFYNSGNVLSGSQVVIPTGYVRSTINLQVDNLTLTTTGSTGMNVIIEIVKTTASDINDPTLDQILVTVPLPSTVGATNNFASLVLTNESVTTSPADIFRVRLRAGGAWAAGDWTFSSGIIYNS